MPTKIFYRFINISIKQKINRVLLLPSFFINFILPFGFIYLFSEFILTENISYFALIIFTNALITIFAFLIFSFLCKILKAQLHLKIFASIFVLYFASLSLLMLLNPLSSFSLIIFNSFIFPLWTYGKLLSKRLKSQSGVGKKEGKFKFDSFEFLLSALSLFLYLIFAYVFSDQKFVIPLGLILASLILILLFFLNPKLKYHEVDNSRNLSVKNYEHSKKFYYVLLVSSVISIFLFTSVHFLFSLNLFALKGSIDAPIFIVRELIFSFLFVSIASFFAIIYSKKLIAKLGLYSSLQAYPLIILFFLFILLIVMYSVGFNGYLSIFFVTLFFIAEHTARNGIYQQTLQSLIFSLNMKIDKKWLYIFIITFNAAFILSTLILGAIVLQNTDITLSYKIILWIGFSLGILVFILNLYVYKISRIELAHIATNKKLFVIDDYDTDYFGIDILTRRLNSENIEEVKLSTIILSEVNPRKLEPYLPVLFRHKNSIINRAILRNIDMSFDSEIVVLIDKFIDIESDEELKAYYQTIKNFYLPEQKNLSDNQKAVSYKIEILKKVKEKPYLLNRRFLVKLDQEDDLVIRSLIGIISKTNNYHSVDYLTHWIKHEKYMHYIADFLVEIGDDVLSLLENFFYHTKPDVELLMKIIEIYGRVGSDYAIELLFNHINYPNINIQRLILNTLNSIRFKAKDTKKEIIFRKIYFLAQNITWLLSYRENFITDNRSIAIIPAIDKELKDNFTLLMSNLKLIYSKELIDLVELNLKKNNYLYASEMLQSVIDQELRNVVLPLIENIPNYKIIRKLNVYFAIENLNVIDQLKHMIKSYPIRISDTTRAKAIEVLAGFYRKKKFNKWNFSGRNFTEIEWTDKEIRGAIQQIAVTNIPDELFLGIFHSSPLVYTTAATILYNINPSRTSYFLSNFDDSRKKLLKSLENAGEVQEATFLERLKYLKRINAFADVSLDILVFIAEFIQVEDVKEGDSISWSKSPDDDVILVYNGIFRLGQAEEQEMTFSKNDILIKGLNVDDINAELVSLKSGKLLIANRIKYFKTLASHEELLRKLYKNHLGINI